MTVDGNLALYWTRQGAPIQERIIIGSLYFFSAIIFLILQLSVIFVFCFYKDLRNHLCYRIMLFISIADSIQLVVHAYGGIICIFDNSFSFYAEKIAGGLANSLSLLNWPICLVLAINRLLVFLPAKLSERKEEILFNWLIALSLLQGLPFFVLYLTPHSTLGFRYYNWDYLKLDMFESENWDWVERTTETLPLPYVIITFVVYLSIFCILMDQRRKMTLKLLPKSELAIRQVSALFHVSSAPQFNNLQQYQNQIMANNRIHQQRLSIQQGEIGRPIEGINNIPGFYKTRPSIQSRISIQHDILTPKQSLIQHERRLLLQAIVLFVVEFSLSTIWFLQMVDLLPDGIIANVLANWYWIFYNGFRPFVYLAMNKTIRTRLLSLWLNKQSESTAEFAKIPRVVQQEVMLVSGANPVTPRRPMPLVNEPIL